VFVIPMENEPSSMIYGNTTDAPYINSLIPTAASASNFGDELPSLPSEPHYIWMEAGTNAFTDFTFLSDADPSSTHSTNSTAHLSTQLDTAGVPWMSYQEDITTGECPVASTGFYAAKHNPVVFFQDVVGKPPSSSNAHCAAHHKAYTDLAGDLAAGTVSGYVFITPNLCDDMHGNLGCPQQGTAADIKAGDTWLSTELPPIVAYAQAHDGVVFLIWDEGDSSNLIPFLALGPNVKAGVSATAYTHSSLLKSSEEMLGVPVLPDATAANDFADMFTQFP
jgi:phosphatidylinositol-3-phosphatase